MQRHLANAHLPTEQRQQLIALLNTILASALDLSTQAKHAHWNVRGRDFISCHQLFDDIAKHLRQQADVSAERATALGGVAQGTARLIGKNSHISEYDLGAVSSEQHVEALSERMAHHAEDLKDAAVTAARLGDVATEDIFIEQLRQVEMDNWFLDASRQPDSEEERVEEERVEEGYQPSAAPPH